MIGAVMSTNIDWADHEGRDPAPTAGLHLRQDFVNPNDLERARAALARPEQLRDWLVERGLVPAGTAADPGAHARSLAIREGIRALARANNQEPMDDALVSAMNGAAAHVPVTLRVAPVAGDGEWQLTPAAAGIDAFLGRIMGIVAGSMADGSWSRIKACRNDTCRWLFYDQSRNRSGTWCTMAVCGSRLKARAYRARQRQAAGA